MLIHAARLINGRGLLLTNATIEVRGSSIVAIDHRPGPFTQDLGDVTLLPGLIDVHVHLDWHFGPSGHYGDVSTPEFRWRAVAENARATLLAGFTTIQSVGWHGDLELQERIANDAISGPRVISSLDPIHPRPGQSAAALRDTVRGLAETGADLIKVFASGSIRDGGRMNVTQEQLDAVCDEARELGLRTLVHAHDSASIVASVRAGCTQVEHGVFADDTAINAMRDAGLRFDPNIGLILQNYLERKTQFVGAGNFTEDGFAAMEAALPRLPQLFRQALAAGLTMPLGTDAVAGAHGQNAREIIARVAAGQAPMDAITGATSVSAESIELGDTIGTLAPGYEADIIAVEGDPLQGAEALRRVKFVMKGGRVFTE